MTIWGVRSTGLLTYTPGVTPYHYCQNNPVSRIDPDGMEDEEAKKKKKENLWDKIKKAVNELIDSSKKKLPDPSNAPTNVDVKGIVDDAAKVAGGGENTEKVQTVIDDVQKSGQTPTPDPKKELISSDNKTQSESSGKATAKLGKLWNDYQNNPNDWQLVATKQDPRQPKGGGSTRELWRNKKTGEYIGVHRKTPAGKSKHPHPFPVEKF